MKRRDFLKTVATGAAAATVGTSAEASLSAPERIAAEGGKASVQAYRQLGKTDIRMSDISFGTTKLPAASLVLRGLDRGINFFDTAPVYGESEQILGEAFKKFGQRDKYFVASKFGFQSSMGPYSGILRADSPKEHYIQSVDASLKRMNIDHIDLVHIHAIGHENDPEEYRRKMADSRLLEAFAEMKKAGKVRYLAFSSHGPYQMEELTLAGVNSGHFDAIMIAYNFLKFPRTSEIITAAKAKGMGIIAMKVLAGAKDSGAKLEPGSFEQAASKWVLNQPGVDAMVASFRSVDDLDTFLGASGKKFTDSDQRVLDRYAALYGRDYCRTGCSDCEGACPAKVPVAHILRQQMYFENYGQEKMAMREYASLGGSAAGCAACTAKSCNGACPHGLVVSAKLEAAHRSLSFTA